MKELERRERSSLWMESDFISQICGVPFEPFGTLREASGNDLGTPGLDQGEGFVGLADSYHDLSRHRQT